MSAPTSTQQPQDHQNTANTVAREPINIAYYRDLSPDEHKLEEEMTALRAVIKQVYPTRPVDIAHVPSTAFDRHVEITGLGPNRIPAYGEPALKFLDAKQFARDFSAAAAKAMPQRQTAHLYNTTELAAKLLMAAQLRAVSKPEARPSTDTAQRHHRSAGFSYTLKL